MEKTADEVKRLQSCINDLISVLALAAIWSGSESCQMLGTLLDSLLAILRLDFACARLNDSIDGLPIEVVRLAQRQHPCAQPQEVGRALGRWLSGDQTASRFVIPNPAGEGKVAIASFSLGLQDEVGLLVAGSRRADFPTDIERLLLRVAANQAAIGLQEARRSGEQKRVAEALERRVAERTRQLAAVNEELRRSQAYLAEAQRLSHTGSFGWRVSTGEILWSEETFRIFQYDRTTKPTVELVLRRTHPEDATLVRQTIERASQDGKDLDFEHRLLMPDGSVKHIHVVGHGQRDKSGELEFVGAVTDITAAKRAEAALREQASLLNLTHDNISVRDMHDVITYWNRGAEEFYGWTAKKAVGKVSHQLTQTVFPAPIEEVRAELLRTGRWEGELVHTKADGTQVVVASRWSLQRDERRRPIAILETNNDVTERKRAEQELAGRLRQQAIVAELGQYTLATPDSQAIMEKAVILLADALDVEYTKVLELLPDGKALRLRAGVGWKEGVVGSATVGTDTNSQAGYTLLSAEPVIVEDLRSEARFTGPSLLRDHGVVSGMSVIIGGGEQPWGVLGAHTSRRRDFTNDDIQFLQAAANIIAHAIQRERAEEALRQAQADLAHVSRVTTMGELTASLAHEVNQPIAAAVTNANTCLRWLAGDTPNLEEAREAASRIVKDATRAAEIISRVRLLFKKGTPERELVDVNEVIREMIVLLRSEATRYSISVRTELAADLPQVVGDRVQLQQVMMNLIINSIDAMKAVDGTRELAIKSQRAENEQLRVSVSDTGVGLPPQEADQIFKAFFTTKVQGTGMGLSISRSIVESHGGRLWAADNSPRGASFYLTLPTKVEAHE